MAISAAHQKATRKWNENNLERLYVTVKKGQKNIIKKYADMHNESINSYINRAIQNQILEDKEKTED